MKILSAITMLLIILVDSLPAIAATGKKAGEWSRHKEFHLNSEGYETNSAGWIIRVDRNRIFNEFILREPISAEKWPSGVVVEDKKDEGLFPFERARVRSLVIDSDEILRKLKETTGCSDEELSFETISLKGIEELSQIVIRGVIPRFKESVRWYLAKDSDWRKGLKRIVVENHIDGLNNISFLGEVKCLSLGTGTVESVCKKWSGHGAKGLEDLSKCYALEQLEIPYFMATNTMIRWGELIRNSPLKNCEVISSEMKDGEVRNAVLLNISANGEISDYVTTIRADAIPCDFRNSIYMPFCVKSVIGGKINANIELTLKRGALLFYPDIMDRSSVIRLRDSRCLMEKCPVEITTAYAGLILSNSLGTVNSQFQSIGSAQKATINLLRVAGKDNQITVQLKLDDTVYPVQITLPNGRVEKWLSLRFRYEHLGWRKGVITLVLSCGLMVMVCGLLILFASRRGIPRKQVFVASLGVCGGILIAVLGLEHISVLQYYTDTYLTGKAMSYLNSSFVSSLVISVSVTLVKLAIGFLQGLNVSLVFVGLSIDSLLQPVQDVLEKISTFSWISTSVLALTRVFCQVLRDGAAFIWSVLGGSLAIYSFCSLFGFIKWECRIGRLVSVALFLALGIPVCLCGCAWFSCLLSDFSGTAFNRSMTDFTILAQSFSGENLRSMAAAKALLSQFMDAVSGLTSSAMFYIATKAFDCFLVPLLLYAGLKQSLKGFSDSHAIECSQIRKILENQKSFVSTPMLSVGSHEGTAVVSSGLHDGLGNIPNRYSLKLNDSASCSVNRFGILFKRLKPEWITAGSALMLCVFFTVSSLCTPSNTAVVAGTAGINSNSESVTYTPGDTSGYPWGQLIFGGIAIVGFSLFEYWCYRKARRVCESTRQNDFVRSAKDKLNMLNERSYWFDLPLYGGLGGTVLGFLIISIPSLQWLANGGRIVAYLSTLLGIVASWVIQKKVISPYKTELMEQMAKDDAAHE